MERVTGIGGFFFRAKDPAALAAWYEEHLGISPVPETYEEGSWWQDEGPTVFAPFAETGKDVDAPQRAWSINFRVANLDAMVAQLRGQGIPVEVDPEEYPNGRFAHTQDPEGNPIELWQASGTDALRPRRA